LDDEALTVHSTVNEPFETVEVTVDELLNLAVEEPYVSSSFGDSTNGPQQGQAVSEAASKKEMIRKKRSINGILGRRTVLPQGASSYDRYRVESRH